MPSGLKLLIPPTTEPVSLTDAKAQVRQDQSVDDVKIAKLVRAARRLLEEQYGMSFAAQTWEMTLDRFPRYSSSAVWQYNSDAIWQQRLPVTQLSGQWYPDRASIRVPRPPFLSVQSLTYFDGNGTPQTIETVIPAAIGSGVQTVTPYDMTGIYAGTQYVMIDPTPSEVITVTSVTSTTFTATFAQTHAVNSMLSALPAGVAPYADGIADTDATTVIARIAPAYGQIWPIIRQRLASMKLKYVAGFGPVTTVAGNISAGPQTLTPASLAGFYPGVIVSVDTGSAQEDVVVSSVTASTFAATYAQSHSGPVTLNAVPESIQEAILLLVGHWYENREAVGRIGDDIKQGVESLMLAEWHGEYT